MRNKGHHLIAREGWPLLAVLVLLMFAAKVFLGYPAAVIVVILFFLMVYFFRNPLRKIPSAPLAVVSPACGRVMAIDTTRDPWLDRQALRIRIKVSWQDVHTLYSPIEGKVMKEWSDGSRESRSDRRHTYWIKTDEGDDIIFSLVLDRWSPFVGMMIHAGERVGQGQACGFLYFAGVVEIYAPDNSRISIKAGDRIDAGKDILGFLVHENGVSLSSLVKREA